MKKNIKDTCKHLKYGCVCSNASFNASLDTQGNKLLCKGCEDYESATQKVLTDF